MEQKYVELLKKFNDKGWDLYTRKKDGRQLSAEDTNKEGPTKELQVGIQYCVWPKGFSFGDQDSLEPIVRAHGQLDLSIEVPREVSGSVTYKFGPKGQDKYPDSLSVYAGERIDFIGLTLFGEDVKLLRGSETHMNLDDFIKALDSLSDISKLVA